MADSLAFVTNAGDGTVSTFELDDNAKLTRVAVSAVGPGCSTLVVDEARRQVHVAVKAGGDRGPAIVTTAIADDGALTEISRREVPEALHYLALTPDGSTLAVTSYGGGFGAVLPVGDDGIGAIESRVDYPNMHSCAVSPDGRFAYFVSLGADLIAQCRLADGVLQPLDPPTAAAPQGSGPRHLVLNGDGTAIYVLTEFSGEVLHYRRAGDGTLTLAGQTAAFDPSKGLSHSRFGADPAAENLIWGADLHLSPNGKRLFASERSGSTLATLPVEKDGSVGEAMQFVQTEKQPRGFALSPDGEFLLCSGEKSHDVSLFVVLPEHQTLEWMDRAETGTGANWVRFTPKSS